MQTPVALYRGIEIHRSKLVLCLPELEAVLPPDWYEARVGEWVIVGCLERVQEEIEKRLQWEHTSNKHKALSKGSR
jgi:hypothetical protein